MRPSDSNPPAARARDAALRRLTRAKRLIAAGATALSGVLAVVAANSFPGRTVKARAAGTQRSTAGTPQGGQGQAKPATPLKPPATRPQPSPGAGGQGGGEPAPPAESASPGEGAGGPEAASPSAPSGEAAGGGSGNEAQAGAPPPAEAPEARSEAPAQAQPEAPVVSGGS